MTIRLGWGTLLLVSLATGCGGKRSETEHLLLRWAEALNFHLAGSFAEGNEYPPRLSDVDPMLRVALPFADAWGHSIHYRRIDDGHYDLASSGPDGEIGNDDDIVVHNGLTQKPAEVYARRPAARGLAAQGDRPAGGDGARFEEADAGDDGYEGESADE